MVTTLLVDLVAMLFGSMFWGCIVTVGLCFLFFGLITFLFAYQVRVSATNLYFRSVNYLNETISQGLFHSLLLVRFQITDYERSCSMGYGPNDWFRTNTLHKSHRIETLKKPLKRWILQASSSCFQLCWIGTRVLVSWFVQWLHDCQIIHFDFCQCYLCWAD